MKFQYDYKNTAFELWQLSIYCLYGSLAGVCNIIFTVSMLLLTINKWEAAAAPLRAAMIIACLIFPVFQPLLTLRKASKQAERLKHIRVGFDGTGVHIAQTYVSGVSDIPWDSVKAVSKKPSMLVVFSDAAHGYVLSNRVLGKEKEELFRFIQSNIYAAGAVRGDIKT
ncbi:MAG: YcxB family protein [Clostridiales bacterium]|jgi:hypothetical protein|nr:YcxB family protein [Clostridiales bacterium]